MITVQGTLSIGRDCPQCTAHLSKKKQDEVVICACGWAWEPNEIVNISARIQGKAS